MPRTILAYQWAGDYHCVACTQAQVGAEDILAARLEADGPVAYDNADTFGVPFAAIDSEGLTVSRIYDTDDWWEPYAQDGQNYAEISCGSYYTWDQRVNGEVPRGHVGLIAEWENPDFEPCDCLDGCPMGDCESCRDREYEADDPDYVRMSGCTCAPCLAGERYVAGMDDAQYDAEFVRQSLIPPFTGRRASRVEAAGDDPGEPDDLVEVESGRLSDTCDTCGRDEGRHSLMCATLLPAATYRTPLPEADELREPESVGRIMPGSARDVIPSVNGVVGWEDDSEDYGGTGPSCGSNQPNGRRYVCERQAGHPGWHGAFGSAVRRGIGETAVWR